MDLLAGCSATAVRFRGELGIFRSDGDPWTLNVFAHGAFGSEVYLRSRQCGHGTLAALAGTAVVSTLWEYAVEAPYKRPFVSNGSSPRTRRNASENTAAWVPGAFWTPEIAT